MGGTKNGTGWKRFPAPVFIVDIREQEETAAHCEMRLAYPFSTSVFIILKPRTIYSAHRVPDVNLFLRFYAPSTFFAADNVGGGNIFGAKWCKFDANGHIIDTFGVDGGEKRCDVERNGCNFAPFLSVNRAFGCNFVPIFSDTGENRCNFEQILSNKGEIRCKPVPFITV